MYEYVEGEAMYPHITTPNTRFQPHKYVITVLTDDSTASDLEAKGISQVRDRSGQPKFDKPAFSFSRKVEVAGRINEAPKLIDNDGNPIYISWVVGGATNSQTQMIDDFFGGGDVGIALTTTNV